MEKIAEFDEARFAVELAEVLGSWPLYRQLKWTGSRLNYLPEKISYYCSQCAKDQTWKLEVNRAAHAVDFGTALRQFRCLNCKEQLVFFAYSWTEAKMSQGSGEKLFRTFLKIGQWPALEERIDAELEKALKASEDLELYKNAIRLRNFNMEIGSMAYMRRIIENHMNEMLDILARDSQADFKLEDSRKDRFEKKLSIASELFPKNLIPEGCPNPFKPLYQLTSDAIHNLSETDSVKLFDDCRFVFEYVFSQLGPHLKREQEFRSGLQYLAKRAAES